VGGLRPTAPSGATDLVSEGIGGYAQRSAGKNAARQRRKITHLLDEKPPWVTSTRVPTSRICSVCSTANVALAVPRPAWEFLVMYAEEFGE